MDSSPERKRKLNNITAVSEEVPNYFKIKNIPLNKEDNVKRSR